MEIKRLKGLAYDKDSGLLGTIIGADYIEGILLIDVNSEGKEVAHVDIDSAIYLEELGLFNDEKIYNHDILVASENLMDGNEGKFWELIQLEDGSLNMQLLIIENGEFVEKGEGSPFSPSDLKLFNGLLEVIGNRYEIDLQDYIEPTVDFNIAIVRTKGIKYLYACNNKETEEIDLIKVVFVGAKLLDGEYSRETVSYEEYLKLIECGALLEVSPQELHNYALGLMYGKEDEKDVSEDKENEASDLCACGERNATECYADDCDDVSEEEKDLDSEDYDTHCPNCNIDYFECDCDL